MAIPEQLAFGRTGWHGDQAVSLRSSLGAMRTLANDIKTQHDALVTKIDADATIPGTYGAPYKTTVAAVSTTTTLAEFANGGTFTHGDDAVVLRKVMQAVQALANEEKTLHNSLLVALDADALGFNDYSSVNEVQTLTVDATAGTFTVTYAGQTTSALAFNVSGASFTTAMIALSNLASGDVVVTGGPGDAGGTVPYVLTFGGTLAATNVAQITANATLLTGGASTATPATSPQGSDTFHTTSDSLTAVSEHFANGGSAAHGDAGVQVRLALQAAQALLNEIKSDHNLLVAHLDADTVVTDTNYAALRSVTAASV